MATPTQAPAREVSLRPERTRAAAITGGGTAGNELLTAAAGTVLLILLAALVVTIIRIGQLLWLHLLPALRTDYGRERVTSDVTGRSGRTLALGGALVAGAVLAVLVIPEFAAWVNASGDFHHHG